MLDNQEKLGGIGKVVEIDESKFGRRKFHRGKHVEGQWVFGLIDRESGAVVLVPVEKRDKETLLPIINRWVHKGSIIMSDCWKAYDCLKDEGFIHLSVNHSLTFKDPETGACTNRIEATWRAVKEHYKSSSRRKYFFGGYLAKYAFLKHCRIKGLDIFETFMRHTAVLYSPLASTSTPLALITPSNEESDAAEQLDDDIII
jgi:transposase-like protein